MNELCEFNPVIRTVGVLPTFTMLEIRDEPMLFSCDMEHAEKLGGVITKSLLNVAKECGFLDEVGDGLNLVIDTRTTLTMPGMYPSIPGWHCDDFNRSERFAQPSIGDRDKRIKHLMAIVPEGDTEISATEFVTNPCSIPLDRNNVWHSLDEYIERNKGDFVMKRIKAREAITFSQDSIHRATPTVKNGWRFFGRISHTYRVPANELRKQVQVFVTQKGW